ncbi:MAG: zinc-ribbon and DUF3426 domain-containing protein [Rhodanobacteraceae bacterium]
MFTQCPECMTVFSVDASTLARAHGCVSCSQCSATFDTMATLCDALPDEPFETLPINEPGAAPPLLLQPVEHDLPPQQGLFQPDEAALAGPAPAADGHHGDDGHEDGPIFGQLGRQVPARRRGSRKLAWLCAALALTLGAQLAWAERASLVKVPAAASLMRSACSLLDCQLPAASDRGQLELTSRDIRRHPSVPGALLISATVRNNANFRQPWPVIGISLSDLDDHKVAMRRFRPAEYLHDAATRRAGLAAKTSAALVFEVADPGRNAVAFEFSFQ